MRFRTLAALLAASVLGAATPAAALDAVTIRGTPFKMFGTHEQGYVAVWGAHAVHTDGDWADIEALIAGGGRTYVVLEQGYVGSGVLKKFDIVDVTTDAPVESGWFEAASKGGEDWDVRNDGTVDGSMPNDFGTGTVEILYRDGKLQHLDHLVGDELTGPDTPPGGDYATFALGKTLIEVMRSKALAPQLRKALGDKDFADAKRLAEYDWGGPFVSLHFDDMVVTQNDEHLAPNRHIIVAVGPDGRVYGEFWPGDGRDITFGNPDSFLRSQFLHEAPPAGPQGQTTWLAPTTPPADHSLMAPLERFRPDR